MKSRGQSLLIIVLLTLVLSAAFSSCRQSQSIETSEKISDVWHTEADFTVENQLKYDQEYVRAASAYDEKLRTQTLETTDSLFALNQSTYCKLIINRTQGVSEQLEATRRLMSRLDTVTGSSLADFHFNVGRYHFLGQAPDSALHYLKLGLAGFQRHYPAGHLRTAQALSLVPLIYVDLDDAHERDSIPYHTQRANNYFLRNPEIEPYDWEMDYVLGLSSLLDRAHQRGEYHSRIALEKIKSLPFENKWLEASIWSLLGHMVKKRGDAVVEADPVHRKKRKLRLYEAADTLFQKAITIAKKNDDNRLMSFHEVRLFNTIRFPDSTFFFTTLETFRQEFENTIGWRPHYERLLGYYYFTRNPQKTIVHCQNFLSTAHEDPNLSFRDFAESFYFLRTTYRNLGQYDKSAYYAHKSLVLYGCPDENFSLNQFDATDHLDSTKRYCLLTSGFVARDLLKKYAATKNVNDLILANQYFEFAEKHILNSLFLADEDEFLTWQFESGTQITEKALETAHITWQTTGEPKWLDRGLHYADNLKSYLLYRDMLNRTVATADDQSLLDSIRLLQGQLNQVLFSLYEGQVDNQDLLSESHSVRLLRNLEHRIKGKNITDSKNLIKDPISVASVRSSLAKGQGMVHYYTAPEKRYGIYIDKDTSIFFWAAEDIASFKNDINIYRQSLETDQKLSGNAVSKYKKAAAGLYKSLVFPFSERLSFIDQLIVIPDQLLAPVPFEAFLSEDSSAVNTGLRKLPYLLRQVKIVYAPSWKTFVVNQAQRRSDFRQRSIGFWTTPSLRAINGMQVIEESVTVGFNNNYKLFSQHSGGKRSFLSEHQKFDVLHLLLHASSSKTNRYDNRIRFGESKQDIIYGFEFYQSKFNAKLMVLASCESATGAPQAGEGTFSLARSLIIAGIPEIVAAQYLIPQTTTGPILARFYDHLAQGKTPTHSLHLAKIDYLNSTSNERHAHPRFWAGMVVLN